MEIKIVKDILEANAEIADQIRQKLAKEKILMINLMSSPGSGKTAILEKIIPKLREKGIRVGVIEGDITTTLDSERLKFMDIPIVQINTEPFGGDCHLGSEVILPAINTLPLDQLDLIFIENVGNLVCPAEFDTGSDYNVVVLSVTEGEDKPLKYPLMFRVCQLLLLNKIDLLPHLDFELEALKRNVMRINPKLEIIETSAKQNQGIEHFCNWLINNIKKKK